MSALQERVAGIQGRLLDMPIGSTADVHGHAVARTAKDEWRMDRECAGSEHTAERIAATQPLLSAIKLERVYTRSTCARSKNVIEVASWLGADLMIDPLMRCVGSTAGCLLGFAHQLVDDGANPSDVRKLIDAGIALGRARVQS